MDSVWFPVLSPRETSGKYKRWTLHNLPGCCLDLSLSVPGVLCYGSELVSWGRVAILEIVIIAKK